MNVAQNAIAPIELPPLSTSRSHRQPNGIPQDPVQEDENLEWSEAIEAATLSSEHLQQTDFPKRKPLVGDWFCEGDLGYIYAQRGVGKTWFSMMLAKALCGSASHLGPWDLRNNANVLYVDGEMPIDEIKQRDKSLINAEGSVTFLQHDVLFQRTGKILNITDADLQSALLDYCRAGAFNVVFLDNLSTLAIGLKESDADDWEKIQPWLLRMRREGIAVVFIHHAGRKKDHMRGTTKREDAAFWVIGLEDASTDTSSGARFTMRFTKDRNSTGEETKPLVWHFKPDESGQVIPEYSSVSRETEFLDLLRGGITSCRDLAEELGCTKGTVSKLATKLKKAGKITIEDGKYRPL